ncbi:MAG: hypothetical protein J0H74_14790 [Chitinophagaceae bacterium]|nr:hypothetical protein [Chitinophagaceae bacterium]
MQVKTRDDTKNLTVSNLSSNVILTITIGNAQLGANVLQFKGAPDVFAKGTITNLDLGPGLALRGKTLNIITNILDHNPSTNGVVATYFFSGCTPSASLFSDTVDNDGDIFSVSTDFIFS